MLRQKVPDKARIKSMLGIANIDMSFLLSLHVSSRSSITIIRGIYENFRLLGSALLLIHGKEAVGKGRHSVMLGELSTLPISENYLLSAIERLRNIRNWMNYNGYLPSHHEVQDAVGIATSSFSRLFSSVAEQLNRL